MASVFFYYYYLLKLYASFISLMGMQHINRMKMRRDHVARKPLNSREDLLIELLQREQIQMYRMAFSYVKNEQDALDVVQETALKAIKYQDQIQEESYMKTWVMKILIRTALDFIQSKSKVLTLNPETLSEVSDRQSFNEEAEMGKIGDFIDLREALESLPLKQRQILELRYFEDFKLETIAEMLETPLSTIKSSLYRTLQALKITLEGDE